VEPLGKSKQIVPIVGTATGPNIPLRIQYRRLAEGVVDVTFDNIPTVIHQRRHIEVGILHHPQALVQCPITVTVPIAEDEGINVHRTPHILHRGLTADPLLQHLPGIGVVEVRDYSTRRLADPPMQAVITVLRQ
jgi:hypothetical protein